MVNIGRPSRGCGTCKARRVKCDLREPQCKRCEISGRECPGVVPETEFSFINQDSSAFTVRQKTHKKKPSPTSNTPSAAEQDLEVQDLTVMQTPHAMEARDLNFAPTVGLVPISRLLTEVKAVAASFFFEHSDAFKGGAIVDLLKQMYCLQSSAADPLVDHSMSAASLVAMHGSSKLPHLKAMAASEYATSLRLAQLALQDPIKSKSDELFMSVILMGMYERSSAAADSFDASKHGRGAIALARHRGRAQFKNSQSYKLFGIVRIAMIMEAAAMAQPLDQQDLEDFWFGPDETGEEPDAAERLQRICVSLPSLRYRAKVAFGGSSATPDHGEVSSLLADAKLTDTKFQYWVQTLPLDYSFSTKKEDADHCDLEEADSFHGMVHLYPNSWIATVYNNYRVARVFVQSIMGQCLSYLAQSNRDSTMPTSFLHTAAMHTVRTLVDDIGHSVPQFLGKQAAISMIVEGRPIPGSRSIQGLVAFWLAKPLAVAYTVEGIDPELRVWIGGRLQYIAREFGFREGLIVMATNAILPMTWKAPRLLT